MKRLILILLSALMFSCGMSQEEKLIADYEQDLGGSKVDLNFRMQSFQDLGPVKFADSIPDLESYLTEKSAEKINQLKEFDWLKNDPEQLDSLVNLYSTSYAGTFLEPTYLKIQELKNKGEEIAGHHIRATYKISNPLLGGVDQEVTHDYLFSSDKSRIIRRIEN